MLQANNELSLSTLPSDIVRRIIPIDQMLENMQSMRLISLRWNHFVSEYLDANRNKLTRAVIDHFHWTVINDRKSTLSMTMSEELQEYFGVGKWPKVNKDLNSEEKIMAGEGIDSRLNKRRFDHHINRLFEKCSRIAKLELTCPLHLLASKLDYLKKSTQHLNIDEFAFTQLDGFKHFHYSLENYAMTLRKFIESRHCKRLLISSNCYDRPVYGSYINILTPFVSTIIIECVSSNGEEQINRIVWEANTNVLNHHNHLDQSHTAEFTYDTLENGDERLRITITAKE